MDNRMNLVQLMNGLQALNNEKDERIDQLVQNEARLYEEIQLLRDQSAPEKKEKTIA